MPENDVNRRQFGKHVATGTALGTLSLLAAGVTSANHDDDDPPPAIAEPIPPNPIPVEILLLEVVRQMYPDRELNHHFLNEIRRDIRSELRRASAIRKVPLTNADEPAALFAAYREERVGDAS